MKYSTYFKAIIVLAAVVGVSAVGYAATFKTGEQPSVASSETIEGDLYIAGGSVISGGWVNGDLITAGGSVLVSNFVLSDLNVAGGSITVLSDVGDDLRAGGGNIIIQGQVGGDLMAGGGQVTIGGPGIGGDLIVGAGVGRIEAPVAGSAKIGGGEIYINSAIDGNAEIFADKVTLGPNAVISGNLTYSAKEKAVMEEGASVLGETKFTEKKQVRAVSKKAAFGAILSLLFLGGFLMALAGALAVALLLRRYSETLVKTATANPLLEIGRGFVFLVVMPAASVFLLFTFIGIPLGILGLILFAGLGLFACIASPIVAGSITHKWIYKPAEHLVTWKTVLLGVAVLAVLKLVPIVGWIVIFGATLLTVGAVVNIAWKALKEWR